MGRVRPLLRRLLRTLFVLSALLVLVLVIPLIWIAAVCDPFGPVTPTAPSVIDPLQAQVTAGISEYARPEEQSYLTLPEWYIVFSADEYAAFIQQNPPSHFPYWRAIRQYWQGYYEVCRVTRGKYPFNTGYHLMLYVIGASFTVETGLRGLYENTMGRVSEWLSSAELSEEDRFAAQVATEYGAFIHTIPWYDFPFAQKLRELWSNTAGWGPNPIRKWERKLALSLEYGGKSLYGWLLKGGAEATYGEVKLEILAIAEGLSAETLQATPEVYIVQPIDERRTLISIPHYEAFTQLTPKLIQQGIRFVEFAGNDEILLTAFAPRNGNFTLPAGEQLFAMPVPTNIQLDRVAIRAPAPALHTILAALESQGIKLEHLYDY
jgi:hypothetical protein